MGIIHADITIENLSIIDLSIFRDTDILATGRAVAESD